MIRSGKVGNFEVERHVSNPSDAACRSVGVEGTDCRS